MADDSADLTFVGLLGNAFYFDVFAQDQVDGDSFQYSMATQKLIRCFDNRFLILNEINQFDRRDLTVQQQSSSGYKLNIYIYQDLNSQSSSGRAVTLYAQKNDKKYAAVCKDENEIVAEEVKELQSFIEASQHKAVFYLVLEQQPNKYKLKSSLYPDRVLGFDETDSNKLILREYNSSSQDDRITLCE